MTEKDETIDRGVVAVKPEELWTDFLRLSKENEKTALPMEKQLDSWGHFLQLFHSYLEQPRILTQPTEQDRQILNNLIYGHTQVVGVVPSQLLLDIREGVVRDVLGKKENEVLKSEHYSQEIQYISAAVQRELRRVVSDLRLERLTKDELTRLANELIEAKVLTDAEAALVQRDTLRREIQASAVKILAEGDARLGVAKDVNLQKEAQRLESLVRALETLVTTPGRQRTDIQNKLAPFEDLLRTPDDSWVRILGLKFKGRQFNEVTRILQTLLAERGEEIVDQEGQKRYAASPAYLLNSWFGRGVAPEFAGIFEDLVVWTALNQTAKALEGQPKAVKAKFLLPFLDGGISAVHIKELVEGRVDFVRSSIYRQVEAVLPALESGEPGEKHHLGRKLAAAVAIASVLALTGPRDVIGPALDNEIPGLVEIVNQIPLEDLADLSELNDLEEGLEEASFEGEIEGGEDGGQGGGGTSGGSGGRGEGNPDKSQDERNREDRDPENSSEEEAPRNDSAEAAQQQAQSVEWWISGDGAKGYYAEHRAMSFNPKRNTWVVNKRINSRPVFTSGTLNLTLRRNTPMNGYLVELPAKEGYALNPQWVSLSFLVRDGVFTRPLNEGTDYQIKQRSDGSYYVLLSSDKNNTMIEGHKGNNLQVRSGFGIAEDGSLLPPSGADLQEMNKPLVNISSLPADMREFVLKLNGSWLSKGEKAKALEIYLKENLIYSFNQEASAYYRKAKNGNEFFQRIAEVRKTDCDVANSLLVALLRSQRIASRMAFGFANDGGPLDRDSGELGGLERHGWVEAYIDNKWVKLDGTPTKMDPETAEAISKMLRPSSPISPRFPERNPEDDSKVISKVGAVVGIEVLNAGLLAMSILLRRRNAKKAQMMEKMVEERAAAYLPEGNRQLRDSLARVERSKFSKIINSDSGFVHPAEWVIPVTGVVRLSSSLRCARALHSFPYARGEVKRTENPNATEFYSDVLGYPRTEVILALYNKEYQEKMHDLRLAAVDTKDGFLNEHYRHELYLDKWYNKHITKVVKKLQIPTSLEEWKEIQDRLIENAYQSYQQACQKEAKFWDVKDYGQYLLDKDDFAWHMECVFRMKFLGVYLRQAHREVVNQLLGRESGVQGRARWEAKRMVEVGIDSVKHPLDFSRRRPFNL